MEYRFHFIYRQASAVISSRKSKIWCLVQKLNIKEYDKSVFGSNRKLTQARLLFMFHITVMGKIANGRIFIGKFLRFGIHPTFSENKVMLDRNDYVWLV